MRPTLFTTYHAVESDTEQTVAELLDGSGLFSRLQKEKNVLIKPNLVKALQPPVTTPVRVVEAIIRWMRNRKLDCTIVVGEGCGATEYETDHCFHTLGYTEMAARLGIELLDLNQQPLSHHAAPANNQWTEIFLPTLLDQTFLISVPVLKAHSLAGVTLSMKNMMGCLPPSHYQDGSSWKKSKFHRKIEESVYELNRYRCPDFTLLDATVGMAEAHLWGRCCDPPVRLLVAGEDPVAIDSYGAHLLNRNWQQIGHIAMANGQLGQADSFHIKEV